MSRKPLPRDERGLCVHKQGDLAEPAPASSSTALLEATGDRLSAFHASAIHIIGQEQADSFADGCVSPRSILFSAYYACMNGHMQRMMAYMACVAMSTADSDKGVAAACDLMDLAAGMVDGKL